MSCTIHPFRSEPASIRGHFCMCANNWAPLDHFLLHSFASAFRPYSNHHYNGFNFFLQEHSYFSCTCVFPNIFIKFRTSTSMNLDNIISRKRSYMKIGMFFQNGIHPFVNHTICTYYLQFSPFTVPPVHPANMANAAAAYASRNRPFERNPTTWVPPSAPQRNGE